MAIFRLCPLEEAIQIIESILKRQIEIKSQDQERPNKHIQAIHDSDAMSNDDKHDVDDGKILQQQTSKDESDAKSHDEHAVTDETVQEITKHIAGNLHDFCIQMCYV